MDNDFIDKLFPTSEPTVENFDLEDAEITYYPNFFSRKDASRFLSELIDTVNWRQDTINFYGKTHNIPRLTAWFGDPGKNNAKLSWKTAENLAAKLSCPKFAWIFDGSLIDFEQPEPLNITIFVRKNNDFD